MDQGYRKIFWGLFFVTFYLELSLIKLLPPFVGWLVILWGVGELKEQMENSSISTESFKRAIFFG